MVLFYYFNPRSHEGSDKNEKIQLIKNHISIHAPTKGATHPAVAIIFQNKISIHAPTKGATLFPQKHSRIPLISIHAPTKGATLPLCLKYKVREFQSTLPRRERLINILHNFSDILISIHAPTKGATLEPLRTNITSLYFNPRSHEGSDSNFIQFYILYFSISINLYQYFPSYFLSLPSPYNFCTFILVRVLLYYRVYLPFAQQSYNKNIIC